MNKQIARAAAAVTAVLVTSLTVTAASAAPAPVTSSGSTQGFDLYNDSAETLVFTSVSGKVSPPPASGKRLLPGERANFQLPASYFAVNTGDAYYNAVSAEGVVLSTVDVRMEIDPGGHFSETTKFDSPKFFTYTQGRSNRDQWKNTIEDRASSPAATQNYVAGSDEERQALQNVCAQNPASCTFTPDSQTQGTVTELLADAYNAGGGSGEPTQLTANKGYSATTTNTWGEQITAGLNISDVINIGVTASHERSIAYTNDFSTSYGIYVDAGYTGYIYAAIPTVVTTGTFIVKLGNTTWTMPGVIITSPDPTKSADRYTSDQLKGDHPLGTAPGSHNPGPGQPVHHHNTCHAWEQELITYPLKDRYRVAAECSYINPADQARGVLDLTGRTDVHTPWFTSTGVVHHSSWATPVAGRGGVRMEYKSR